MPSTLFAGKIDEEITEIFHEGGNALPETVTESDLNGLPNPVQHWLREAGVIGKERAVSVRLKQEGFFRRSPDSKWMPYHAVQYYTIDVPAFLWHAKIKALPVMRLSVRDKYQNGHGNMLIRLFGLIPVGNATDPKLDQGTLLRFLNETMWFPSAALSKYITWEAIDDSSARATMEYKGVQGSAIFYFNKDGMIKNMVANRYMEKHGEYEMHPWATPISKYRTFDGITIPAEGEGIWKLDSGDFSYIKLKITEIQYNVPGKY